MPRNAATKNPPGGRRVNSAAHARRNAFVANLLIRNFTRAEVVEACGIEFKMAPRTVDDHIARVRHQWRHATSVNQHEERQKALERLDYLTRKMEETSRWSAIIQAERLKADLLGLRAEVPIDTARDDGPEMPPEQYVEAILVAVQERCEMLLREGKNDVVALVIERATTALTSFTAWGSTMHRGDGLADGDAVQ